jgi:hypothetical protein
VTTPSRLEAAFRLLDSTRVPAGALADVFALRSVAPTEDDPALAWLVARVAFVAGPPGTREPTDRAALDVAIQRVRDFARAKGRVFYRLGDTSWSEYVVAGLWPVTGEYADGEDRALILRRPKGEPCSYRIPADFSACWMLVRGQEGAYSPWLPEYAPPLVRHLAPDRAEDWDACGFIPAEHARSGHEKLPAPIARTGGIA